MTAAVSRDKAVSAFLRARLYSTRESRKDHCERAAFRRKLSAGRQLWQVPMLLRLDFRREAS